MSGGYFDYQQYHLNDIADKINSLIKKNNIDELNEYGDKIGHSYSQDTIKVFEETVVLLKKTYDLVHKIDYLVSGDCGEDDLHKKKDILYKK